MATETTTQKFVPIKEIRDGIVLLESGQMCSILLASSVNFALKSSDEQRAILAQFQSFLNTIDFSLQIYVQSRRLDIAPYLELLAGREATQDNDLMRIQLREYIEFIRTFTSEVEIMTKNFFVVIPYSATTIDVKGIKGLLSNVRGKEETASYDEDRFFEDRVQLEQRVSVVEQGLSRIGVVTAPLGNDALIEVYYHIFNPGESSNAPRQ